MPNGLYWEQWYDDPMIHKEVHPQDQGILYENRLVGLPRLRQVPNVIFILLFYSNNSANDEDYEF